jgi:hypothetical protein
MLLACESCGEFAQGIKFDTIFELISGGFPFSGNLTDDERYTTRLSSRLVHDVDDAIHILDLQLSQCASILFRGLVVLIALKRNVSQYFREYLYPNCLVEEQSLTKLLSGAHVKSAWRGTLRCHMDYKAIGIRS